MAELIGDDGKPISCWEPKAGCYFAKSAWTEQEARDYVRTGEYPQRLLNKIRADYETSQCGVK